MKSVERRTTASPAQVWEVLSDGWTYPVWVVGTSRMRAVSANWPEPGAKLHHSVGVWPTLLNDETEVAECEPQRRLRLIPKARPFGAAFVEITLEPDGEGTRIRIEEDVISGAPALVPSALRQVAVEPRNKETLLRLALLAERRTRA